MRSSEQTGQERNDGSADQGNTAAGHQLDLKEKDSVDTYEIAIDDDEYDIDPEDDAPDESKRTAADYGSLIL